MKNKLLIIIGIVLLVTGIGAPFVVRILEEKKINERFIDTYSYHKDFWTIYPLIKESREIVQKNKTHDGAYHSLAQSYYTLTAFDEAVTALQKALEIKPDNDAYWFFLGKTQQSKKVYPLAAQAYEKALELNPTKKEHFQTLAWLYYFRFEGDEHKKAFDILEKAVKRFPNDKDVWFDLTRYNLYDNNIKAFLEYAPKYLALNPGDEGIKKEYENYKKLFFQEKKK